MRITCDCETTFTSMLGHYQWTECPKCGKEWWALQPKRFGPLVAFPMPQRFFPSATIKPALIEGWDREPMQNGGTMTKREVELVAVEYAAKGKRPHKD